MTPGQSAALRRIAEAAVAAEKGTGVPAKISAAQCIPESAWLQVAPGFNCVGIKAKPDDHCQYCLTKEYLNGEWVNQKLAFATYPTLAACFAAHARLLQCGPASAWERYQANHDLDAFIRGIAGHYATDPGYAGKILQLAGGPHVSAAIVGAAAVSPQETAAGLSILTVVSAAVNVYVGLRLAALQSKQRADNAALEVSLVKQFPAWKDEVLAVINGKYVSAQLIVEIRTSIGRELTQIELRLDRVEKRCEERPKECLALRRHLPE